MTSKRDRSVLGKAWEELRALFSAEPENQSAPVPGALAAGGDDRSNDDDGGLADDGRRAREEAADAALARYCAKTAGLDTVVAGRVHLLNLEAVKVRLGDRWERARDRVHALVESELQARLAARDFFSRIRSDSYVIVFSDCDEAEAKLRVSLLTDAVLAKLFGSEDAEALRAISVQTVVARADGEVATRALGSVDALVDFLEEAHRRQEAEERDVVASPFGMSEEEIDGLLRHIEVRLRESDAAGRPIPSLTNDHFREMLRHLQALEGQFARRLDELTRSGDVERPDISLSPGQLRFAYRSLTTLRRLKAQAETKLQAAPQAASADSAPRCEASDGLGTAIEAPREATPGEPELSLQYAPFWHVPTGRFGVYRALGQLQLCSGERPDAAEVCLDDDLQEAVDRLVLLQSRRDLEETIAKAPAIVMIPVHYSTLARIGSQRRYVDLCRNINREHRRFITWELCDVPRLAYQDQLQKFTSVLRGFGRGTFLSLTINEHSYQTLARDLDLVEVSGISAIGFDVAHTGASEEDSLRLFEYVTKVAAKPRLKCFATGLETRSLAIGAICSGFEYVAGPAVSSLQHKLTGVRPAALEQLYLKGLAASAQTAS